MGSTENIDWLVEHGFTLDLLNMLMGQNDFADLDAFEKLDIHSRILRSMTIRHLEFLIEYGDITHSVTAGDKILSPYPEYFSAWKLACCPGVSLYQLDRLVAAKRSL